MASVVVLGSRSLQPGPTPHLITAAATTSSGSGHGGSVPFFTTRSTTKQHIYHHCWHQPRQRLVLRRNGIDFRRGGGGKVLLAPCKAQGKKGGSGSAGGEEEEGWNTRRELLQAVLWGAEGAYILWLFLLPYAPGDPVWHISSTTVNDLVGLSLNFFFVLPLLNSVGIHAMEAPVLHPVSEGLFNFVIGWTLLFAPLLFTDYRRDRYKGSLDLLWGLQMFLTNTFLIPYMAIRLNDIEVDSSPKEPSQLSSLMTRGATVVGITGGLVCTVSAFWCLFGQGNGSFGGVQDRWEFLGMYIGSERLAYAFIWDIIFYSIFQPWLIGDNLQNLKKSAVGIVSNLRFIPVIGLIAYLLSLDDKAEV